MEYTSSLYHMAINPKHKAYSETVWNTDDMPIYIRKNNTVYQCQRVYERRHLNWLEENGVELDDNYSMYAPIITVENGIVTTYETLRANVGNFFLQMDDYDICRAPAKLCTDRHAPLSKVLTLSHRLVNRTGYERISPYCLSPL